MLFALSFVDITRILSKFLFFIFLFLFLFFIYIIFLQVQKVLHMMFAFYCKSRGILRDSSYHGKKMFLIYGRCAIICIFFLSFI